MDVLDERQEWWLTSRCQGRIARIKFSPDTTINNNLISLPFSSTVLLTHGRNASGRNCEGHTLKEARMLAYKTSSRPNGWNQDTLPEGHVFDKNDGA